MNSPRAASALPNLVEEISARYSNSWFKHCDDGFLSEMDAARLLRTASNLPSRSEKIMMDVIVGLHTGKSPEFFTDEIAHAVSIDPYNEAVFHNMAVAMDSRGFAEEALAMRITTAQRLISSKSALISACSGCFRYRDVALGKSFLEQLRKVEGRPTVIKGSFKRSTHGARDDYASAEQEERVFYAHLEEEFKDVIEFDTKIDIASSTVRKFLTSAHEYLREKNYLCHVISHDTLADHTAIVSTLYVLDASERELCELNNDFCDFVVDRDLFHERMVVLFDTVSERELNGDITDACL